MPTICCVYSVCCRADNEALQHWNIWNKHEKKGGDMEIEFSTTNEPYTVEDVSLQKTMRPQTKTMLLTKTMRLRSNTRWATVTTTYTVTSCVARRFTTPWTLVYKPRHAQHETCIRTLHVWMKRHMRRSTFHYVYHITLHVTKRHVDFPSRSKRNATWTYGFTNAINVAWTWTCGV